MFINLLSFFWNDIHKRNTSCTRERIFDVLVLLTFVGSFFFNFPLFFEMRFLFLKKIIMNTTFLYCIFNFCLEESLSSFILVHKSWVTSFYHWLCLLTMTIDGRTSFSLYFLNEESAPYWQERGTKNATQTIRYLYLWF